MVVLAVVAAVVAAGAAVDAGVNDNLERGIMRTKITVSLWKVVLSACVVVCLLCLTADAAEPAVSQKGFDTAKAAADALIQAAEKYDVPALREILGPGSDDLVASDDQVRDKARAQAFAAKAKEKTSIEISSNKKSAIVVVGSAEWPLPIPVVLRKGKWFFDTKEGKQQILLRRIGANELDAITICRGYVDAQHEYASQIHDDSGVNQYAQKIISTQGKHDGLVWRNEDGTLGGPISEGIAKAIAEGYTSRNEPYHGYYFKILKGQGPAAPLGQIDFVIQGAMIGGFALVAAPAEYRVTGVKTFIVSHDGVVYEKDLGKDTLNLFMKMERYNPDKSWSATKDEWPAEAQEVASSEATDR